MCIYYLSLSHLEINLLLVLITWMTCKNKTKQPHLSSALVTIIALFNLKGNGQEEITHMLLLFLSDERSELRSIMTNNSKGDERIENSVSLGIDKYWQVVVLVLKANSSTIIF